MVPNFRVHFTLGDDVYTHDVVANNPGEAATQVRKEYVGAIIIKTKVLKESTPEEA